MPFKQAENAVILFGSEGLGVHGSASLASACASLLQETGHAGKANNGLIGVWERANDQGAWETGLPRRQRIWRLRSTGKTVYHRRGWIR